MSKSVKQKLTIYHRYIENIIINFGRNKNEKVRIVNCIGKNYGKSGNG